MNDPWEHFAAWKKLDTKVTYCIILLQRIVSNQWTHRDRKQISSCLGWQNWRRRREGGVLLRQSLLNWCFRVGVCAPMSAWAEDNRGSQFSLSTPWVLGRGTQVAKLVLWAFTVTVFYPAPEREPVHLRLWLLCWRLGQPPLPLPFPAPHPLLFSCDAGFGTCRGVPHRWALFLPSH